MVIFKIFATKFHLWELGKKCGSNFAPIFSENFLSFLLRHNFEIIAKSREGGTFFSLMLSVLTFSKHSFLLIES